ncbi:MAG: tyrosine-type recombinase/integrase [Thermoplasmatales archaeon]|nr:tyrosine-type recombinase/integrase [Thermoplasmatales archaeon]
MVKPYNYTIEDELRRLENEPFNGKIKGEIKKFVNDLKIKENISEIRRINYIQRLRKVAEWIPDSFLDPKEEDIEKILEHLSSDDYSDWTRDTYITMLKKFYKWKMKNLPDNIAKLKIKVKENGKAPDDLITREEIKALVGNSKNARDRALFSVLYDSGCRIGEIINMRVKDLSFDEFGALLKVTGKTGFRQVRIIGDSIAYLRAWLDNHPQRNDPNAFLFCNLSERISGRNLTYADVYSIIRQTSRRAGIKRRIHPHLFRHTRATILASKVTEAPLEAQMGWVHGSKQTRTYVHLSLRDQDNAILKAYGIKVNEDDSIKEDRPKECPRCHTLNPSDAQYCRNCWMPFDIKTAIEMEEKKKEIEKQVSVNAAVDPLFKKLLNDLPDNAKVSALIALLEDISSDPEKLKKFREGLGIR